MKIHSTQRWDNGEDLHTERGQGGVHSQVLEKGPEFGDKGRVIPEEAYTQEEVDIYQSDTVQYFILLEVLGRWGCAL